MGQIRILVFFDGTDLSQKVNTFAQNVWERVDHPRSEGIYIIDINESQGNVDFATQVGVTTYPTVMFAEIQPDGSILTITGIAGATTEAQIEKIYLQILNGTFVPGTGGDGEHTPIITGDGEETSLGLFGFGLGNIPANAWLLGAAVGAYKSATTNGTAQLLWGAKGIACSIQYFRKRNKG